MSKPHEELARWPLLLASATLGAAAIGVDLAVNAPTAYGLAALSSAALGAFLYAEGARHREWLEDRKIYGPDPRRPTPGQEDLRRHADE